MIPHLPLPWPFERDYMQAALLGGLIVGATAPLIGAFLVQRRMSLLGDGIGHVSFAGVAVGALVGVRPLWTALLLAVAGALGMDELRRRMGARSGDAALALIFYSGIAAGVVLFGLAGSFNAGVFSYLFGSILTIGGADLMTVVVLGAVIVVTIATIRRALFAVVADDAWARVAGLPVNALDRVLVVLTAVTVVAAMRVVGVLLVAALMVLPVTAVQRAARSFRRTMQAAVVVGVGCVVAGLAIARWLSLAPGATIVLCCAAVLLIVLAVTSARPGGRGSDVRASAAL